MKPEKPNITVVIPAFNAEKTIGDVLRAAVSQQGIGDIEIIVVDDGSTDATAHIIKSFPVRYIYQENAGPAKARNTGWKAGKGDIVCFTDSDCIPHTDWAEKIIAGFDGEGTGAVAGSYDIANPGFFISKFIHEEIKLRHSRFGKYIRAFGSYNVAIRRDVLERAGGFDEGYRTASGEDNDLSYKILRMGYKIRFIGDALVAHFHTQKLWKYLREQFRHGFWRMKLYKDHPQMSRGDDYTTLKDIIEPPMTVLAASAMPFLRFKHMPAVFMLLLFLLFSLQLPVAFKLVFSKKDMRYLFVSFVTFLRAFSRTSGMLKGIWKFWV